MNYLSAQKKIETLLPIWFGLLVFLSQISTSLKSFPLVFILLSLPLLPNFGQKLKQILHTKWCQAALLLFCIALLACFWGPAETHKKLAALKQYDKLLFLPFIALGLSDNRNRKWFIVGFFSAMTLTACLSILGYFDLLTAFNVQYDHVFFNHIFTGFSMSFAALLALFLMFNTKGKSQFAYFGLFTLFSIQILVVSLGRTGYILYCLMLGLYVLLNLNSKKGLVALLLIVSSLSMALLLSNNIQNGVRTALSNYQQFEKDKNTSVGYRVQFHQYAFELFKDHPWLGNGIASYSTLFYKNNKVPQFGRWINEPHSMYWLVASEFGLAGIVALLWFFGLCLVNALKLKEFKIPAIIFMISFIAVNFTDSLLYYSGSGYFYVLFVAYFLSDKKCFSTQKSAINIQKPLMNSPHWAHS